MALIKSGAAVVDPDLRFSSSAPFKAPAHRPLSLFLHIATPSPLLSPSLFPSKLQVNVGGFLLPLPLDHGVDPVKLLPQAAELELIQYTLLPVLSLLNHCCRLLLCLRLQPKSNMEDMADLFDHIEDLLDFPCDEDLIGLVDPCGGQAAPLLLPPLPASAAGVGEDSLDGLAAKTKKLGAALTPEEDKKDACDDLDLVQLEWMSKFLDDSDAFPLDLPNGDGAANSDNSDGAHAQVKAAERCFFRTSSPVSVLEANTNGGGGGGTTSSSSSSSSSFSYSSSSTSVSYFIGSNKDARAPLPPLSPQDQPLQVVVPARARSKRPRPASFSPRARVAVPYFSPPSDVVTVSNPISSTDTATSEPESFGESRVTPPPAKKGKATKKAHAAAASGLWEEIGSAPPVRKCMHCEIQKTPQWRAGPMGPKTLCNACGVRYKSGRLFPEYRPAASPTFVPAIHSNSHKKVVEMRVKSTQNTASAGATDNCDLLQCIRRRE